MPGKRQELKRNALKMMTSFDKALLLFIVLSPFIGDPF
jgi:hypothetical protein